MTIRNQSPSTANPPVSQDHGEMYELKVKGLLDDHWSQWFEGMVLKREESTRMGQECTVITGWIKDQPALHGLLAKIRDLNLPLISVRKLPVSGVHHEVITWGLLLAYCIHLLDEIFLNGGSVYGVQRHIWPAYNGLKFGIVNTVFLLLICLSSYLYNKRPAKWILLPLFWLWERTWNAVWHILWALIWKEYSPGLVTSVLFGLILFWFLRQEPARERLSPRINLFIGAVGLGFEVLLISTLFIFR